MVASHIIADWDTLASSLGRTPKLDGEGKVIPIGKIEDSRPRYYVVWYGRAIGIFCNWGLAHAMVGGFTGACYKKYYTLREAQQGWEEGPRSGPIAGNWTQPAPRPAVSTAHNRARVRSPTKQQTSPQAGGGTSRSTSPDRGIADIEVNRTPNTLPVPLPLDAMQPPPSDDEETDEDADMSVAARSPAPSSISSISIMTATSLTSGTLSPGSVSTPYIPLPLLATTPASFHRSTRLPAARTGRVENVSAPSDIHRPASVRTSARPVKRTLSTPQATSSSAHNTTAAAVPQTSAPPQNFSLQPEPEVAVAARKDVYVVVRGDYPGVYFDRHTAMIKLGTSPGMKLVRFKSLKKGTWYFVQEYMAGRVGIPVVIFESSD